VCGGLRIVLLCLILSVTFHGRERKTRKPKAGAGGGVRPAELKEREGGREGGREGEREGERRHCVVYGLRVCAAPPSFPPSLPPSRPPSRPPFYRCQHSLLDLPYLDEEAHAGGEEHHP